MFLIPLVIYSAWICPFELAFLRYLPAKLLWIENILNSFFAIDIVLTFFVACLDRKSYVLIDDPKRIAVRFVCEWFFVIRFKNSLFTYHVARAFRYLSSGFVFDILSTAPFEAISLLFRGDGDDLGFKILNMLRLWRLWRVSSFFSRSASWKLQRVQSWIESENGFNIMCHFLFDRLEKDIRFNYFCTRCTKLVLVSFSSYHPPLLCVQTKVVVNNVVYSHLLLDFR